MSTIIKALRILPKKYKKKSILFVFLLLIATLSETIGVGLIFSLIDLGTNGSIENEFVSKKFGNIFDTFGTQDLLKNLIFIIIFVYFFKSIYLTYFNYWQAKFQQNVYKSVSQKLFEIYLFEPISFFYKRNSSQLLRNTLMECKNYAYLISIFLKLIVEISLAIFIFGLVLYIEPYITTLASLGIISLILIYYFFTSDRIFKYGEVRSKTSGQQIKVLGESFSSIRDIKLKAAENFFLKLYKNVTKKFIVSAYRHQLITESPKIIIEFIFVFVLLSGLLIYLNINSNLTSLIPLMTLYAVTAFKLLPSMMRVLNIFQQIKGLDVTVNILSEEFKNLKLLKNNEYFNESNFKFNEEIKIKKINFSYENRKKIFQNFSENIEKNSCTGIIGKSGSGKSTLIDLITGIISPNEGQILVDGSDIKKNIKGWQKKIGYVSQSVFLLDTNIMENVAFGEEIENIDLNRVKKCLENSQFYSYISDLNNGIHTKVGEKGVQLSGGQRQRIAIARELYRKPELLILDEATSALDIKTEDSLLKCLENIRKETTILIVSHRKNTLKNCDKIIEI